MRALKISGTRDFRVYLFLILPALFFYLSIFFKNEMGFYHLFGTDAEYAYLFNGLNLCYLNFPFHVQGPGTPLHIFSAIIMTVVHLFRNQGSLIDDVMKNPDVYLTALHASLTGFTAILLFILGFTTYKISKNVIAGLFIQLIPYSSWLIFDLMRRYMLENLIIADVLGLLIILFIFINSPVPDKHKVRKYVILFSLAIGLIGATKLMYLPIAIIPFLVIPGYKNKGLYVLFSILAFAILAFAIFHDWATFINWHLKNFLHSGQYGKGDASIANVQVFMDNLKTILHTDGVFKILFLLMLGGIVLYHIPFLKVKVKDDLKYYALIGIVICMGVMTALVSKQLKYYYMITVLVLKIPGAYLLFDIYTRPIKKLSKLLVSLPLVAYFLFVCYRETMVIYSQHDKSIQRREYYMEAFHYASTNFAKDQPTLLIPDYYGAPYKEYGIFFGMSWSGSKMAARYAVVLNKLYPNIYFYHGWNNLFNQWDHSSSYAELLKKYQKIVLFVGDPELEKSLYSKLHGLNRQLDVRWKKIKYFPESKARFYEVSYDSTIGKTPCTFNFNSESVDSAKHQFMNEEGFTVGNGTTQSSEYARSGKFSCKLVKEEPFGLTCFLSEVQKNEHYIISVWKYDNGNKKAGLVLSSNNKEKYYNFQAEPVETVNHWQKLVIDFVVPDNLVNEDFKIYVWNEDSTIPAYFDDLSIERR
jgi:hypothetical protein